MSDFKWPKLEGCPGCHSHRLLICAGSTRIIFYVFQHRIWIVLVSASCGIIYVIAFFFLIFHLISLWKEIPTGQQKKKAFPLLWDRRGRCYKMILWGKWGQLFWQ